MVAKGLLQRGTANPASIAPVPSGLAAPLLGTLLHVEDGPQVGTEGGDARRVDPPVAPAGRVAEARLREQAEAFCGCVLHAEEAAPGPEVPLHRVADAAVA